MKRLAPLALAALLALTLTACTARVTFTPPSGYWDVIIIRPVTPYR